MNACVPLLVFLAFACSKEKEAPKFGEAIGAEVEAKDSRPAFAIALAVAQPHEASVFLPKVVGAVSNAMGACPDFAKEQKSDVTALHFRVLTGKLKITTQPDTAGSKCIAAQLEGKDVGTADQSGIDGRVEIKLGSIK